MSDDEVQPKEPSEFWQNTDVLEQHPQSPLLSVFPFFVAMKLQKEQIPASIWNPKMRSFYPSLSGSGSLLVSSQRGLL